LEKWGYSDGAEKSLDGVFRKEFQVQGEMHGLDQYIDDGISGLGFLCNQIEEHIIR
jgi:hypothetical protein